MKKTALGITQNKSMFNRHAFFYFFCMHFSLDIYARCVYINNQEIEKITQTKESAMTENIKKEINWETQSGKNVSVKIELTLKERIWADGHEVDIDKCEINITTTVEGMGVIGYGRPLAPSAAAKKAYPTAAGMIGKLIIMQPEMDKINTAIAELEAHPAWQAKNERIAKTEKESAEYDKHRAKMKKAMGY